VISPEFREMPRPICAVCICPVFERLLPVEKHDLQRRPRSLLLVEPIGGHCETLAFRCGSFQASLTVAKEGSEGGCDREEDRDGDGRVGGADELQEAGEESDSRQSAVRRDDM
jgi:hypothetical protein